MQIGLIIVVLLLLLGGVAALLSRGQKAPELGDKEIASQGGCCGMHATCEKDSLLSGVSSKPVYYDDEELDRFFGHSETGYSEAEIDEFRDILVSLQPDDVAGWVRSLQLRQIMLPTELMAEMYLIVGENRSGRVAHS